MNTDDRQQQREQAPADAGAERSRHIDTLARAACPCQFTAGQEHDPRNEQGCSWAESLATLIFDSTDPAVQDALTAALHANADRARVLAAHADAGWLDEETKTIEDGMAGQVQGPDGGVTHVWRPPTRKRRLVTPWEPTQ